MLHLGVLGSGSSGNSALVCHGETRILIDAGLSARQLCLRLEALGIDPDSLTAILLTHEHGDHVRGLEVFCRKRSVPIYATTHTSAIVRESISSPKSWKQFEAGRSFHIESIEVQSFPVPHDAVDPVGFLLDCGRSRLGILSDVGHVTHLILDRLKGVDTLFTEANYDAQLLQNDTKRPWSTKQRISNRHGHLSNEQTAELVGQIASPKLNRVVLGHLSNDCNTPDLAIKAVSSQLEKVGYNDIEVVCAERHEAIPLQPVARLSTSPPSENDASAYKEIAAESTRVCEPSSVTASRPSTQAQEWRQTEWSF